MSRGVVAGIQARTGSSRLPGKVLADVGGTPLILRVVERARASRRVDEVLVLTSTEPADDALAALLEAHDVPVRRGPLHDVLARYAALLEEYDPRYVVRITGDCPLIEPAFVDLQIEALEAYDADLTWIRAGGCEGTLAGQGVKSARALRRALSSADPRDREHVGSFFFQSRAAGLRFVELEVDPGYRRPGLRLSVDEAADLEFVRALVERVERRRGKRFALRDVLAVLDEEPGLLALNRSVVESADNRLLRSLARERAATAPPEPVGRWPRTT